MPASLQWPWEALELGSDPLPGAGAVFWCPTMSWDSLVFVLQVSVGADGAGEQLGCVPVVCSGLKLLMPKPLGCPGSNLEAKLEAEKKATGDHKVQYLCG